MSAVPEVSQKIIKRVADPSGDILIPVGWEFQQLLESWLELGLRHALILVKREATP